MVGSERDIGPRERLARSKARWVYLMTMGTVYADYLSPGDRQAHEIRHFAKLEQARTWLRSKPPRITTNVLEFPGLLKRQAG